MHPVFSLFGVSCSAYALLALLGVAAALILGQHTRRGIGLSRGGMLVFSLCCIAAGVLGAKLLFILVELSRGGVSFSEALTGGGFVFYGGLFGAVGGGALWCRATRSPFLPMMDLFVPCFALFHAIGRVGCFLAGCCYGCVSEALGVVYPEGGIPPAGVPLLPVQLWEAGFLLILTVVLLALLRAKKRPGTVFGIYLTGYSLWRFVIEFFRADPRGILLGMPTSQFLSVLLLLVGAVLLARLSKSAPGA